MKCFPCRREEGDNFKPEKLKLDPPQNSNYTITKIDNQENSPENNFGNRFEIVQFNTDYTEKECEYPTVSHTCYQYKKSLSNSKYKDNQLVILHITSLLKNKSPFTILLSHGMSSTLGTLYPFLIDLSIQMKCDIIAYDYSGFGLSGGKATEHQMYSDIIEVGSFVTNILMVKPYLLILFGLSIGSMPTIHLGISSDFIEHIAGLILLSPYSKGFYDSERNEDYEYYVKIRLIKCPVFVIHGKKDLVIPFHQSDGLTPNINTLVKWFPSKGDHHNITTIYRYKLIQKLKTFMNDLLEKQRETCFSYKVIMKDRTSTKQQKVVIDKNYAESAESFDAKIFLDRCRDSVNHEILIQMLSEDLQIFSDDDSNGRKSRSIMKVGTFYFGQDVNDITLYEEESYYSNDDLNIANDEINFEKYTIMTKSPLKSSLKSSLKSAINSAKIQKKTSNPIPNLNNQKSLLLTKSIRKKPQAKRFSMLPKKKKSFKYPLKQSEIDALLKPISDFPELE